MSQKLFPSVLNIAKTAKTPPTEASLLAAADCAGVDNPLANLDLLVDAGMLEFKDGKVVPTPKAFGQQPQGQ